jgi:CheY-like chemotaxis protein
MEDIVVRNRKKILVVDDNPVNLSICEEILSSEYRLQFARSGSEAIRIAERFQPGMILLDVMMSGMDGLDVCRRFRQLAGLSDCVIIMLSAKAMPSEQADGIAAGADEYLTKPFEEAELLCMLRKYTGGADFDRECATWNPNTEGRPIATY